MQTDNPENRTRCITEAAPIIATALADLPRPNALVFEYSYCLVASPQTWADRDTTRTAFKALDAAFTAAGWERRFNSLPGREIHVYVPTWLPRL